MAKLRRVTLPEGKSNWPCILRRMWHRSGSPKPCRRTLCMGRTTWSAWNYWNPLRRSVALKHSTRFSLREKMVIMQCCSDTQYKFITSIGNTAQNCNIKAAKERSKNAIRARFLYFWSALKKKYTEDENKKNFDSGKSCNHSVQGLVSRSLVLKIVRAGL